MLKLCHCRSITIASRIDVVVIWHYQNACFCTAHEMMGGKKEEDSEGAFPVNRIQREVCMGGSSYCMHAVGL